MFKSKYGPITNPETGESKDIVISDFSNSLKDVVIGGAIVMVGVIYLTVSSFRNGSKAYDKTETQTLLDLDLLITGK